MFSFFPGGGGNRSQRSVYPAPGWVVFWGGGFNEEEEVFGSSILAVWRVCGRQDLRGEARPNAEESLARAW